MTTGKNPVPLVPRGFLPEQLEEEELRWKRLTQIHREKWSLNENSFSILTLFCYATFQPANTNTVSLISSIMYNIYT